MCESPDHSNQLIERIVKAGTAFAMYYEESGLHHMTVDAVLRFHLSADTFSPLDRSQILNLLVIKGYIIPEAGGYYWYKGQMPSIDRELAQKWLLD